MVDDKRALSSAREVTLWMLPEVSGMGEVSAKSFCERVSGHHGDGYRPKMNDVMKVPDAQIQKGIM